MAMTPLLPIAQGIPARVDVRTSFASSGVIPLVPATMNRKRSPAARLRASSRGFTLIEMLVSLAITLIMMGAVVTLFGVVSESVSGARSAIEMADRLRGAKEQLQLDLQGVTATMKPPLRPEMDQGYFEIIEEERSDAINGVENTIVGDFDDHLLLIGDTDDKLMFTVRNRSAPFLGKANGAVVESPVAEVIYFLAQDNTNSPPVVFDATTTSPTRLYTLYRRVLLVAPSVGDQPISDEYYNLYDVSARPFPSTAPTAMRPNTLGDLTKRENRFGHTNAWMFPLWGPANPTYGPAYNARVAPLGTDTSPSGVRVGDDILLTNVLSFDVGVWDPGAPVYYDATGVAIEPSDPGWYPPTGTPISYGAYVDLGYGKSATYTPLTGAPIPSFIKVNPNILATQTGFTQVVTDPRTFDTWSLHYENDGLTSTGVAVTAGNGDLATNGLDDDGDGLVDERDLATPASSEYDTHPPYVAPLRGIKVTIRTYEPSSQQVREAVVIQNFDTK